MWNIVVIDASAKIPIGILEGNFIDNGHFYECLAVKDDERDIRGQHCMLKLRIPKGIWDLISGDVLSKLNKLNIRVQFCKSRRIVLMMFILESLYSA